MTHSIPPSSLLAAEPVATPEQAFGPTGFGRLRSAGEFAAHLKRLDERGRRLRFGSPVNDGFIEAYARRQCDGDGEIVGLFVTGTLRGVAELCPFDRDSAEGAFSLERTFRGRGHGMQLFEALLAAARRRGIASLTLQCLRENVAMQRIAQRFAAELTFDQSEVTARIAVRPRAPARMVSPFAALSAARSFSFLQPA